MGPVGLFDEAADKALSVGHGQTEAQRLAVAVQRQSHRRAAPFMLTHEPRELKIAGGISAYNQKILVPIEILAVFHRARGAARLLLRPVGEGDAQRAPVAEAPGYVPGAVFHRRADIGKAVIAQETYYMLHQRRAAERDERLRRIAGNALEPRTLAPRHNDSLHSVYLLLK